MRCHFSSENISFKQQHFFYLINTVKPQAVKIDPGRNPGFVKTGSVPLYLKRTGLLRLIDQCFNDSAAHIKNRQFYISGGIKRVFDRGCRIKGIWIILLHMKTGRCPTLRIVNCGHIVHPHTDRGYSGNIEGRGLDTQRIAKGADAFGRKGQLQLQ